jgi:hypothetical protein
MKNIKCPVCKHQMIYDKLAPKDDICWLCAFKIWKKVNEMFGYVGFITIAPKGSTKKKKK